MNTSNKDQNFSATALPPPAPPARPLALPTSTTAVSIAPALLPFPPALPPEHGGWGGTGEEGLVGEARKQLRSVRLSRPTVLKLVDLLNTSSKDPDELFYDRLLCRKGIALFAGPSGVGKSTLLANCVQRWALGREAFGLKPSGPQRILVVQAENDRHDTAEQTKSTVSSMGLSPGELAELDDQLLFVEEANCTGATFCELVRRLALEHKADLIVIDPVLAYLGGDANSQVDVGNFLRQQLRPLLAEVNAGAILIHHVPKPTNLTKKPQQRPDAYVGAGSAEWTNAPRTIFSLEATEVPDHYVFRVAKRGKRARWTKEDGKPTTKRYLRQSHVIGDLCWYAITEAEHLEALGELKETVRMGNVEEFVQLFPDNSEVNPRENLLTTDEMKDAVRARGWDVTKYAGLRDRAVEEGLLGVVTGAKNAKLTGRKKYADLFRRENKA